MEIKGTRRESYLGLISDDLSRVEEVLYEEARGEAHLIIEVSGHMLKSGGKRFRPALLLLASKLCNYNEKDSVYYAAAIEFAHTATLIHDDVVDEATMRRGRPSANVLWGNQASVLVGDYLLFKAFSIIFQLGNYRVLGLLNEIALQMAEGEAFQLERRGRIDVSEAEYFSTIIDKTGSLMSATSQIGAILGGVSLKKEESLADFGLNLGIAFQLVDDALDYRNFEPGWGKQVGKDFFESKTTLPLIRAYKMAGESEKKRMRELFTRPEMALEHYEEVLDMVQNLGGIEYTMEKARQYIATAKKNLDIFPESPYKVALCEMADFVVEREY